MRTVVYPSPAQTYFSPMSDMIGAMFIYSACSITHIFTIFNHYLGSEEQYVDIDMINVDILLLFTIQYGLIFHHRGCLGPKDLQLPGGFHPPISEVPMAEAFKGKSVALYFAGEWSLD